MTLVDKVLQGSRLINAFFFFFFFRAVSNTASKVISITLSLNQSYNPKHPPARGADGFMLFYTHSESPVVHIDLSVKNLAYTGFCGFTL